MKHEELMQILHDPENQPSQFGTVPVEMYEAEKAAREAAEWENTKLVTRLCSRGVEMTHLKEERDELGAWGERLAEVQRRIAGATIAYHRHPDARKYAAIFDAIGDICIGETQQHSLAHIKAQVMREAAAALRERADRYDNGVSVIGAAKATALECAAIDLEARADELESKAEEIEAPLNDTEEG